MEKLSLGKVLGLVSCQFSGGDGAGRIIEYGGDFLQGGETNVLNFVGECACGAGCPGGGEASGPEVGLGDVLLKCASAVSSGCIRGIGNHSNGDVVSRGLGCGEVFLVYLACHFGARKKVIDDARLLIPKLSGPGGPCGAKIDKGAGGFQAHICKKRSDLVCAVLVMGAVNSPSPLSNHSWGLFKLCITVCSSKDKRSRSASLHFL